MFRFLHYLCTRKLKGSLAQLVQSICLTSRGSAVRIRQLPHEKRDWKANLFFVYCLTESKLSSINSQKYLHSQTLLSLKLVELELSDGCVNKNEFYFKGISASATPVESVNSHTEKRDWKANLFFCLLLYRYAIRVCADKIKSLIIIVLSGILCTRSRDRTGTAITGHRILSPACLPIPPFEQPLSFR